MCLKYTNTLQMRRRRCLGLMILCIVAVSQLALWITYKMYIDSDITLVTFRKQSRPYSLTFETSPNLPYVYGRSIQKYAPRLTSENQQNWASKISKVILFHKPPDWMDISMCSVGIQMCSINNCHCSNDIQNFKQADAVIINAVNIEHTQPPVKSANQVWISFGLESPVYYHNMNYRNAAWRKMFNWTMTYRLDSDIPIPYNILVHKPFSIKNHTEIASSKTKSAIWIVSNCETSSKREDFVKELRLYYDVDIYGQCGKKCPFQNCLAGLEKEYRFYLSFENSLCMDYISEKLFKIYEESINLVPVVRGGADYESLMPAGTYINTATFSSPRKLAEYLKYLERNVTAYSELLQKKDQYVQMQPPMHLYSGFCDICVKLNHLDKFSEYYHDTVKWLEEAKCYKPNDYNI